MTTLWIDGDVAIDLDRKCPDCRGAGAIQAEEWREYWIDRRTWAEGVDDAAGDPERRRPDPPAEPDTPEEVTCGACDGRQRIPTAAGEAVLEFVRRHQGRVVSRLYATVWASHAPEDGQGADVWTYETEREAWGRYLELCREWNLDIDTGYDDIDDVKVEAHVHQLEVGTAGRQLLPPQLEVMFACSDGCGCWLPDGADQAECACGGACCTSETFP